jgi:hypothetical protein
MCVSSLTCVDSFNARVILGSSSIDMDPMDSALSSGAEKVKFGGIEVDIEFASGIEQLDS